MITLSSYLFISTILFLAGIVVMIARKNIVAILLGIELILNASALNFVAYTKFVNQNLDGHIFPLFIIIVAAAEAAIGLAIIVIYFKNKGSIQVEKISSLKG